MEEREVRARIPACLRKRRRGEAATDELLHFLQYPPPSLVAGRNDTGHGILRQSGNKKRSMRFNHVTHGAAPQMIDNRRNFT